MFNLFKYDSIFLHSVLLLVSLGLSVAASVTVSVSLLYDLGYLVS